MHGLRADTQTLDLRTLDFELPQELIAVRPADRREDARLLVYERTTDRVTHSRFSDIASFLKPRDLLVLNDTRVEPTRVLWHKPGGGHSEILFLRCLDTAEGGSRWEALVSGKRVHLREAYSLPEGFGFRMVERLEQSRSVVEVSAAEPEVREYLSRFGHPPLPPYIRNERKRRGLGEDVPEDAERYQTVFAQQNGAVAAPTAGLHFSNALLALLAEQGISADYVTLHVGWGTFQPVTEEHVKSGKLHPEWVDVGAPLVRRMGETRAAGGRVIAVGTTVVRSLEWWAREGKSADGIRGWCDLFLMPGWTPTAVDVLITNFHLPASSLLALVAGFLGKNGTEGILGVYKEAIAERYRFFSYGDAMLIL